MSENDSVKRALAATPECPAAEDLENPESARHVESCLHCRTELELLHRFESGTIAPEEADAVRRITVHLERQNPFAAAHAEPAAGTPSSGPGKSWWSNRWLLSLGTAVALVLVLVSLVRTPRGNSVLPEFGSETLRARAFSFVATPESLSWTPVPNAADYEVTCRLLDGSVVFHKTITTPTFTYPADIAKTVNTGKLVSCEITAHNSSGKEIGRSGAHRLQRTN